MIRRLLSKAVSIPKYMISETYNQFFTDYKWTSFDYLHRHSWKKGDKFTSVNGWHKHKIDLKNHIALPGGFMNHTHKLKS